MHVDEPLLPDPWHCPDCGCADCECPPFCMVCLCPGDLCDCDYDTDGDD